MHFTLKTKIKATPKAIYEAWLSSEGHTKMTGGEATASDKAGDNFTAWDGYISGKNIDLLPFSKIVQSWRTSEFDANEPDSQIEILLEEKNGGTELTLNHTNVPESGDHYKRGWAEHYFEPMQEHFEGLKAE